MFVLLHNKNRFESYRKIYRYWFKSVVSHTFVLLHNKNRSESYRKIYRYWF